MQHGAYTSEYLASILKSVKTIALVGASPKPVRASYIVMKYLQKKGFRVIPVNPGVAGQEILGETVYAALEDIPHKIDMVDIFRSSEAAGPITDSAIAIGAKVVWMQLGIVNEEAAQRAEEAGLQVIMDRCPKIEYSRLSGEAGFMGLPSRVVSARRQPLI